MSKYVVVTNPTMFIVYHFLGSQVVEWWTQDIHVFIYVWAKMDYSKTKVLYLAKSLSKASLLCAFGLSAHSLLKKPTNAVRTSAK